MGRCQTSKAPSLNGKAIPKTRCQQHNTDNDDGADDPETFNAEKGVPRAETTKRLRALILSLSL